MAESHHQLLPITAQRDPAGVLHLGGCSAARLADRFGTPLYIYDGATLNAAVARYEQALQTAYPADWRIAYAAKAWLCTATADWAARRGLALDVVSGGELAIALAAGFPAERIHLHGNNKSPVDLDEAIRVGVGRIVIDHLQELELVNEIAATQGRRQRIWLRINPDVAVDTHRYRRTGHAASKFGLLASDGTAETAALLALRLPGIELTGLHCHIGSQFREQTPLRTAIDTLLSLWQRLQETTGWQCAELSPGGGWAVAYIPEELDNLPSIDQYVIAMSEALVAGCQGRRLSLPQLVLEPGRSLVARSGVALYGVGAIKRSGNTTYVFINGGMADNPRPALYGARYAALLANRWETGVQETVRVAGPYCESGDVLIRRIQLPALRPGDLLAVPMSGAYQLSMSSNYNGALRPAVAWVENGQARLIQRRETHADLLTRDLT